MNSVRSTLRPDSRGLSIPFTALHDLTFKTPGFEGVQRMDVLPMSQNDWFRIDDRYCADIAEKIFLLENHPTFVSACLPEAEAGCRELLGAIVQYLSKQHPKVFVIGENHLHNTLTGDYWNLASLPCHSLDVAGLLVQEDLVLLHRYSDGKYRVAAASVCFPSNWSLRENLGKTVSEIHMPVPGLNANIGATIDTLLARLKHDRPLERVNFLVYSTDSRTLIPELQSESGRKHLPVERTLTPDTIGGLLYLRQERETISRLPLSGDVLFTLHTYITPFSELPLDTARSLHDLLLASPEDYVRDYKNLDAASLETILSYLRRIKLAPVP